MLKKIQKYKISPVVLWFSPIIMQVPLNIKVFLHKNYKNCNLLKLTNEQHKYCNKIK